MNSKIKKILSKKNKKKIICLTAYSKSFAEVTDKYADITLVGDSLGSVLYNYDTTKKVTLTQMIEHSKSVRKGIKTSLMVVDMPYNTYRNKKEALINAKKIIKSTKCDAVKIESNNKNFEIIKEIRKAKIPVMGHIGLQPQSVVIDGGYKIKGKNKFDWSKYIDDAKALEDAGAFSMVLEGMAEPLAKVITSQISIPTIGIGASPSCDGQILVTEDMIGLTNITPKFVKEYINIGKLIEEAANSYSNEVRNKEFPTKNHTYSMNPTIIKSNKSN